VTQKRFLVVFAAAATLLVALDLLVYSQYRTEVRAVTGGLDDRLMALGSTTARWLATGGTDPDALLAALVHENRLEDAYVLDHGLAVTAGVRTRRGQRMNLLRVDQARLAAAEAGTTSVGDGYSIDNASVEVGYFPVARSNGAVVVLEAGAEYREPATEPRTTFLLATALSVVVAAVFGVALWLALRALERSRLAHGRAERLAAVGQMAAMVAHEVRNPLGILRGQVELARERIGPAAPPRELERFTEMLAEIGRITQLTDDFLGLARDARLEIDDVDLGALAAAIVADARIAEPEVTFALTEPAAPVIVAGDAGRLRQAIWNVVMNAAQVGGPGVTVAVGVDRADRGRARITVRDDGPGVPPELAARLFEPFVSGRTGGTGLGLAIALQVVERHAGTLVLESPAGVRGATFSIYLPVRG